MPVTPDDLFASPDQYLHSFDGENAVFVEMDRAAYQRSIFLDRRISPVSATTTYLPVSAFAETRADPLPISWIFHIAHCGSTLLARALDDIDANLVLREPQALRQSAINPDPARLDLVISMISKRYRSDAPTVVKANVPVNFLLPQIAQFHPATPAIMLYLPLRDYLLAVLRDQQHRDWVRNVTRLLSRYIGDLSLLGDGERVAALWLAQIDAFTQALFDMPNACALDAEHFFAEPAAVLKAATRHLDVQIGDPALDAIVAGPVFNTYSKNPTLAFDNDGRIARRAESERMLTAEIAAAERWISLNCPRPVPEAALVASSLTHR